MRIESKIILIIFTIIILVCLLYKKENFYDATPAAGATPAGATPTPTPISLADLSPLSSLDITLNNLSTFANGINLLDPNKVTPTQLNDLKQNLLNEVKSLSTSLNSINDQMKLQQNKDTLNKPTNQEDSIDLKTTQLLQNKEIAKLTNRLNTLKTLYQNYSQEKAVNEYPKIPIYSSCIVAEASGGYSLDNLNKKPTSEKPIVYANQAVVPGTQTYNPNKNVDINNPILTLEDILHQLSKNDINVNFNI